MSKKDWQLLKEYQATGLTPEEIERVKTELGNVAAEKSDPKWIYDYELCIELEDIGKCLSAVNNCGYQIIGCCGMMDCIVIMFRRPADA